MSNYDQVNVDGITELSPIDAITKVNTEYNQTEYFSEKGNELKNTDRFKELRATKAVRKKEKRNKKAIEKYTGAKVKKSHIEQLKECVVRCENIKAFASSSKKSLYENSQNTENNRDKKAIKKQIKKMDAYIAKSDRHIKKYEKEINRLVINDSEMVSPKKFKELEKKISDDKKIIDEVSNSVRTLRRINDEVSGKILRFADEDNLELEIIKYISEDDYLELGFVEGAEPELDRPEITEKNSEPSEENIKSAFLSPKIKLMDSQSKRTYTTNKGDYYREKEMRFTRNMPTPKGPKLI